MLSTKTPSPFSHISGRISARIFFPKHSQGGAPNRGPPCGKNTQPGSIILTSLTAEGQGTPGLRLCPLYAHQEKEHHHLDHKMPILASQGGLLKFTGVDMDCTFSVSCPVYVDDQVDAGNPNVTLNDDGLGIIVYSISYLDVDASINPGAPPLMPSPLLPPLELAGWSAGKPLAPVCASPPSQGQLHPSPCP